MLNQTVIFPGQGTQRKGMTLDFYSEFRESKQVFDVASDILSLDIFALIRDGDPRLDLTEYTQPCILTAEIAMHAALLAHFNYRPRYFGGHSLGEYAALVAAGVLPFSGALKLVKARGRMMQDAVQPGLGTMIALIRETGEIPLSVIRALATQNKVDIANDNSRHQIVISGLRDDVELFCEAFHKRLIGAEYRLVPLTVSAPFHSRHMMPMEIPFREELKEILPRVNNRNLNRVLSNYSGGFHSGDASNLLEDLVQQISAPVRWRENMSALLRKSPTVIEVGPHRPLSAFFKSEGFPISSVIDVRSAKRVLNLPLEEFL